MNFEQSIARDNEEDHAYTKILIFARLLSKKKELLTLYISSEVSPIGNEARCTDFHSMD